MPGTTVATSRYKPLPKALLTYMDSFNGLWAPLVISRVTLFHGYSFFVDVLLYFICGNQFNASAMVETEPTQEGGRGKIPCRDSCGHLDEALLCGHLCVWSPGGSPLWSPGGFRFYLSRR